MQEVVKGYSNTWSGLNVKQVKKYCTKKIVRAKDQMKYIPLNTISTYLHLLKFRNNHNIGLFVLNDEKIKNSIAMDFAG